MIDEPLMSHRVHKIDSKGRISIPAFMRPVLGEEFVVSRGAGKCLALYPIEEWKTFMAKIQNAPGESKKNRLAFFYAANAEKVSLDGQGRIILTDYLRRQVSLDDQTEAVVFGHINRIEIWNRDFFYEMLESISDEEVIEIQDELGIQS